MELRRPSEGLPLWPGAESPSTAWHPSAEVLEALGAGRYSNQLGRPLNSEGFLALLEEHWEDLPRILEPAIAGLLGEAPTELLRPPPFNGGNPEEAIALANLLAASYLLGRIALGTEREILRYSSSLGLGAACDHLKGAVQGLNAAGLIELLPPDLFTAASSIALGARGDFTSQPVVADDHLDALLVGVALAGLGLALAEFDLVLSYLDSPAPVPGTGGWGGGKASEEVGDAHPHTLRLENLPMWFRRLLSRITNPNEPRLTSALVSGSVTVTISTLATNLDLPRLFPRRVKKRLWLASEVDRRGLVPFAVIRLGVVLGSRLDEVSRLAGLPPDGLVEEITRQSIRFEWPHIEEPLLDEMMRLVYEDGPFDFPFREERESIPPTASYRIVRLFYPFLPTIDESRSDFRAYMLRNAASARALALLAKGQFELGYPLDAPESRWLSGVVADPSWE